jgi:hypothetical protein
MTQSEQDVTVLQSQKGYNLRNEGRKNLLAGHKKGKIDEKKKTPPVLPGGAKIK